MHAIPLSASLPAIVTRPCHSHHTEKELKNCNPTLWMEEEVGSMHIWESSGDQKGAESGERQKHLYMAQTHCEQSPRALPTKPQAW
jgi:hypothetical protein